MCIKFKSLIEGIIISLFIANVSYGAVFYLPGKITDPQNASGYNDCKTYMNNTIGIFQQLGCGPGTICHFGNDNGYVKNVFTDATVKSCLLTHKGDAHIYIYATGSSGSKACINNLYDCTSRGDIVVSHMTIKDFYNTFLPNSNYDLYVYTGGYGGTTTGCNESISGGGGGATAVWTSNGSTHKLIVMAGGGGGGYHGGRGGGGTTTSNVTVGTIAGVVYHGGDSNSDCGINGGCGGSTTGGKIGGQSLKWVSYLYNGNNIYVPVGGGGGDPVVTQLTGNGNGGFGGGGGSNCYYGGGGGGFTGGGKGNNGFGGGGGSSFCVTFTLLGTATCYNYNYWALEGSVNIYLPLW